MEDTLQGKLTLSEDIFTEASSTRPMSGQSGIIGGTLLGDKCDTSHPVYNRQCRVVQPRPVSISGHPSFVVFLHAGSLRRTGLDHVCSSNSRPRFACTLSMSQSILSLKDERPNLYEVLLERISKVKSVRRKWISSLEVLKT